MEFLRLINHSVKSKRWNTFYRCTSDSGSQYIVSTNNQKSATGAYVMTDWACGCLGWVNHHKDCRHIRELKARINSNRDIPTITPTRVNRPIFEHAQDETAKTARSISKYLLDEFAVLDLTD